MLQIVKRWARRMLERAASSNGETHLVLPASGAALYLRDGEALALVLPTPETVARNPQMLPIALLIAASGVILRDREQNRTLYEAVVTAATEFGFPLDKAQGWAGELVGAQT